MFLESLKKIGLNPHEQDVYFALLQLEKATANQIAQKSQVKRPTTYDILYRLKSTGFISETFEGKKHYFVANPPQAIVRFIEEEKRELTQDLPELLSIYNTKANKPKIAYFEGVEGIKQLYEDTLLTLQAGDEILAYVSADTVKYFEDYSIDYIRRRTAKKIHLRGIYQDSAVLREYLKKNFEQLRISKVVPYDQFPLKNEINIYANKVIIITYKPEPFGILIESKEIADTQRAIFEMAWRGIK